MLCFGSGLHPSQPALNTQLDEHVPHVCSAHRRGGRGNAHDRLGSVDPVAEIAKAHERPKVSNCCSHLMEDHKEGHRTLKGRNPTFVELHRDVLRLRQLQALGHGRCVIKEALAIHGFQGLVDFCAFGFELCVLPRSSSCLQADWQTRLEDVRGIPLQKSFKGRGPQSVVCLGGVAKERYMKTQLRFLR